MADKNVISAAPHLSDLLSPAPPRPVNGDADFWKLLLMNGTCLTRFDKKKRSSCTNYLIRWHRKDPLAATCPRIELQVDSFKRNGWAGRFVKLLINLSCQLSKRSMVTIDGVEGQREKANSAATSATCPVRQSSHSREIPRTLCFCQHRLWPPPPQKKKKMAQK